ncbi:MAG TPA: zinc ribbon domain-containing protein [Candidatus Binataceae bacterium]|jgi:ribosomal protein S27AE
MLYLAATLIILGVAIFVAAPLLLDSDHSRTSAGGDELARLEHDRALAIAALRELEFDRAMNKLSDSDSAELRAPLETRALFAMAAIEALSATAKSRPSVKSAALRPRSLKVNQSTDSALRFRFCPDCGARAPSSSTASFCPECGRILASMERAS